MKKRRAKRRPTYQSVLKRLTSTARGRAALARYRRFWGIKYPPTLKRIEIPGPKKGEIVLVGMGRSPAINLADGLRGKKRRIRRAGIVVCDPSGRRISILSGKNSKAKRVSKRYAGYVPVTEYIPTAGINKAGSFKKRTHWVHEHSEGKGRWPKAHFDQAGNLHYGKSTYSVSRWIRR